MLELDEWTPINEKTPDNKTIRRSLIIGPQEGAEVNY